MQRTENELAVAIDGMSGIYHADENRYKEIKKEALEALESEGVRISEGTVWARVYNMYLDEAR